MTTAIAANSSLYSELSDLSGKAQEFLETYFDNVGPIHDRMAEIQAALSGNGNGNGHAPAKRGRKPGSTNKPKVAGEKKAGKRLNEKPLTEYVLEVLKHHRKGMELKNIVVAVREAGFKSKAAKFSQTVYVALYKLMDEKQVTKDSDSRQYHLVKAA